jgi:DNA polymerase (family 10)
MKSRQIADLFDRMADVLEFKGENAFKVNAYRRAARVLRDLREDVETIHREARLDGIPGIGDALAKKIGEFIETGRIAKADEVIGSVPGELMDLLRIPSLGPKTLSLAHRSLRVENIGDLKEAIRSGRLAALPGMGGKKAENLRKGIERIEQFAGRIPLGQALPAAEAVMAELRKQARWVGRITAAGSLRRMAETVGDIDILVETDRGEETVNAFCDLPAVTQVLARGGTKGSVLVEGGLQVDLRVVPKQSFGAALQYFTGSKAHNVRVRELARKLGTKVNEYGIFRGEKRIGGADEGELYERIGLPWIPPELREDSGEIEAALENALPALLEPKRVLGDLHVHTEWSDGAADIPAMAKKAESLGYRYVAVCDHSQSASYAGGLSPDRLLEQIRRIRELNRKSKMVRILAGTETDIRQDGTLDFPDALLSRLDIVVASVHSGFKQRVTERLVAAARHPRVTVLGHPTGRLIGGREGYAVDLDVVMKACAGTNTAMEINAFPQRLDLNDTLARRAKEMGVRLALGTDAHHPDQMEAMRYGVAVARRAWLGKKDVLNGTGPEKWKRKKS